MSYQTIYNVKQWYLKHSPSSTDAVKVLFRTRRYGVAKKKYEWGDKVMVLGQADDMPHAMRVWTYRAKTVFVCTEREYHQALLTEREPPTVGFSAAEVRASHSLVGYPGGDMRAVHAQGDSPRIKRKTIPFAKGGWISVSYFAYLHELERAEFRVISDVSECLQTFQRGSQQPKGSEPVREENAPITNS